MKHRIVRAVILAVVAVGAALTQQACANSAASSAPTSSPVAAPSPTARSSSGSARRIGTGASPTTTTTRRPGSVPVCRSSSVAVDVTFQDQRTSGKTRMALVALTNKSAKACKVSGRAAISLTNAAGDVVDVATREVDQPGKAVPITLKPGTTAFEGIKWTVCDKADASCAVGNGMRFNLEASTDGPGARLVGFPAAERSDITMKSLAIGTLQPSSQGVVAW